MERLTEFTWEKMRSTVSCEKSSKEESLRDNVTEKGMVLFNKGLLGSAHGITVKQGDFRFPSWSFSKEKASANSPPLSHRRASMIAGTERPAFRRRSLRERKCSAPGRRFCYQGGCRP
ncbi:MAG: hypothetical protein ACLR23_00755 [Clostridia bacterium]